MAKNIARFNLPPMPTIGEIIRDYKLGARKRLSQNFLLDQNLSNKIVRQLGESSKVRDSWVCEVGPGPGGITRSLLQRNIQHLAVIEKDARFLPSLEMLNKLSDGMMSIYHGDVLNFNMDNIIPEDKAEKWEGKTPKIHLVGNLPFNISTPLIIKWLEQVANKSGPWKYGRVRMTLTFQKEVQERMTAAVAESQRSRLSIMTQYLCHVRHCFTIPGKAFVPKPDVDVSVVHFVPRIEPLIDVPFKYVEKVVRHVFHYRQKHVKHGIRTLYPPDRPELTRDLLSASNVNPETRPFLLSNTQIGIMAKVYHEQCSQEPDLFSYYYRAEENVQDWRYNKLPLEL